MALTEEQYQQMAPERRTCDVCGAPAMAWAWDIVRRPVIGELYYRLEYHGEVKSGCEEHIPESIEHKGPPLQIEDAES